MKYAFLFCLLVMLTVGCITKPKKKFFIKSVKVSEDTRIDWYVYSSTTSLAPDYLQISTYSKEPFFVSYYLTDINFRNDSLTISLWRNGYKKLDESRLDGIKVLIDTTNNGQWNGGTSRFGRLQSAGVNMEFPHFVDVYCPNGACNDYDTISSDGNIPK